MALITVIPGAVAHIWGFDPYVHACWLVKVERRERVLWAIGTAHAWTLLSAAVALFSTVAVLAKLIIASHQVKAAAAGAGVDGDALSKHSVLASVALRILPHPTYLGRIYSVLVMVLSFTQLLNQ